MPIARILAMLMLAVVSAGFATTAFGQIGPTTLIGGPGGGNFTDQCPEGEFLIGVNTVKDRDLNAIAAVCQYFDAAGHAHGGQRGLHTWGNAKHETNLTMDRAVRCPADMAAESIQVQVSKVKLVHSFVLICRNPNAHDYWTARLPYASFGGETSYEDATGCGGGALAVGLIGRYGSNIDALGLLCKVLAPQPDAATTAPAAPLRPDQKPIHTTGSKKADTAPPLPVNNGGGGDGGGGSAATAPGGTTIYREPNGDDSDANVVGYVEPGGSVTVVNCDGGFCRISKPKSGWVWGEDIGR